MAAIMFTDIVGYTHLSQINESLALELVREHQRILRTFFVAHGGSEVKTMGDAFLIEFPSALEAVLCAVDVQKKMRERNADVAQSRRLELRIGIHVGDVVHEGNDIYGDAVNVASRIEPLAEPGGICISQQVLDQVRNKTSLRIEEIGEVELRNVDFPVRAYSIDTRSDQAESVEAGPVAKERVAVLPFVNISPDPNDEYFADGLTEELIAKLSMVAGLKVIARTSVMGYKRKDRKVSEIARDLGVGSIVEGSVRKSGNRVRVSVQLIDPNTQDHIWAGQYDNQMDDIFAIQSDVASKVSEALSAAFFPSAPRMETRSIEAYTLYLKAVQLSYDTSESAMKEVVGLLERAISFDPNFAKAHAALADEFSGLSTSGYEDFEEMSERCEAEARKALALDPGLAEAHSAMASAHVHLDRFDAALAEAETAVRINPNLSEGYIQLGILYSTLRTVGEALPMFKKAYELDPLFVGTGEMLASMATYAGDYELAWSVLERMREFLPKVPRVYLCTADYHMARGDLEEAQKMVDVARSLTPEEPSIAVSQGLIFAMSGNREGVESELRKVMTSKIETARLWGEIQLQAALGNLDDVFRILTRQAQTHSWAFDIRIDPLFAKVRADPRFKEFCQQVGIRPSSGDNARDASPNSQHSNGR